MSLAATVCPALCSYSLWEALAKQLGIVSLCYVRVAPANTERQRAIPMSAIQRGFAHLMRPINDACPEYSRPYSL